MSDVFSEIRKQFPALSQSVNGYPLVYLDSAATSLKPKSVIDALTQFYSFEASNVHRGAHYLANMATEKLEAARDSVKDFISAQSLDEVVFTKGTTDSINLIAQMLGEDILKAGDEIVLTEMEHHSNIVPWQILAKRKNLKINWARVDDDGEIDFVDLKSKIKPTTKVVSVVHCSNTLGTINNVKEITSLAHGVGALMVVDAAQSVTLQRIDVSNIDCDFLVFSSHKIYGPFGTGILYGKKELLNKLPPVVGGGAMISTVSKDGFEPLSSPQKFEAGTPNVSGIVATTHALKFVNEIGMRPIEQHARELLKIAEDKLSKLDGFQPVGRAKSRANILSFNFEGVQASDLGQLLDQQGVAVRVGHHCTQPLMKRYGISGTIRASFGVYTNEQDVDMFVRAVDKSLRMLR